MKKSPLYVGLMSGTSLDAVDGVLVDFSNEHYLLATANQPIPPDLRKQLAELCQPGDDEIKRIAIAEHQLTQIYTTVVNELLKASGISAQDICAIGSHGQTIRHLPELGYTLQIGDPNLLAEHTKIAVVADFRRRDMAAGGEGAPLVPAFHHALLGSQIEPRTLINVGGMANISNLSTSPDTPVTGFDTGPGNVLMDIWCLQHKGLPYDANGAWANSGTVNKPLLNAMLSDDFFQRPPPKSTGREHFNESWLVSFTSTMHNLAPEDVQATLLELTAQSISQAIQSWGIESENCFICGGGAHNSALINRLGALLPERHVGTTKELGLDPDWVEATAFAWLAKQRIELLYGNLPSVTRARGPRVLGAIYPA